MPKEKHRPIRPAPLRREASIPEPLLGITDVQYALQRELAHGAVYPHGSTNDHQQDLHPRCFILYHILILGLTATCQILNLDLLFNSTML